MNIYVLTPVGRRVARNINNPKRVSYDVIAFLDKHGAATIEQIANNCGIEESEAKMVLGRLRRNRPSIVTEASSVEV